MNKEVILTELQFKAVRSSGAGGQNVNKVASKVGLSFDLLNSKGLTEEEKNWLHQKLKNKLSKDCILNLTADTSRSQKQNKDLVIQRFLKLLEKSLQKPKLRKNRKLSKIEKEKRLRDKRKLAETKTNRKKPNW